MNMTELFGEPISAYSRKDAIRDGVLVELSRFFPWQTRYYRYPVACTAHVWEILSRGDQHKDIAARVSNLCEMSTKSIVKRIDPTTVIFDVTVDGYRNRLKAVCSPGDDEHPVITIMGQQED